MQTFCTHYLKLIWGKSLKILGGTGTAPPEKAIVASAGHKSGRREHTTRMNERRELALEALETAGVKGERVRLSGAVEMTRHDVEDGGLRPKGRYLTLTMNGAKWGEDAVRGIEHALDLLRRENRLKKGRVLVAGLGNRNLLCDRFGWDVADKTIPSERLATFCPMVKEQTGLESADTLRAIADLWKPDLVLAVDALVCKNPKYLMDTVELSDAGLTPGGGVGRPKKGIDKESMGVPTWYLGVPTLSFVNPWESALCVTREDIVKKNAEAVEAVAAAIMRVFAKQGGDK